MPLVPTAPGADVTVSIDTGGAAGELGACGAAGRSGCVIVTFGVVPTGVSTGAVSTFSGRPPAAVSLTWSTTSPCVGPWAAGPPSPAFAPPSGPRAGVEPSFAVPSFPVAGAGVDAVWKSGLTIVLVSPAPTGGRRSSRRTAVVADGALAR